MTDGNPFAEIIDRATSSVAYAVIPGSCRPFQVPLLRTIDLSYTSSYLV